MQNPEHQALRLNTVFESLFIAGVTDSRALGISHLALHVSNLDKSRRFYTEVFGMKEAFHEPGEAFLWCGEDLLALHESGQGRIYPDAFHFGFKVRSRRQVEAWRDWLVKNDIIIEKEHDVEEYKGVRVRDPDGYEIEVFYEPKR